MAIDFSKLLKKRGKPTGTQTGPVPGMPVAPPPDVAGMSALLPGAPPTMPQRKPKPKRKGKR